MKNLVIIKATKKAGEPFMLEIFNKPEVWANRSRLLF